jgi:hypothetical protein
MESVVEVLIREQVLPSWDAQKLSYATCGKYFAQTKISRQH